MSNTPRTDKFEQMNRRISPFEIFDYARGLERELNVANAEIFKLRNEVEDVKILVLEDVLHCLRSWQDAERYVKQNPMDREGIANAYYYAECLRDQILTGMSVTDIRYNRGQDYILKE